MAKEIKIGERILDYMADLGEIQELIQEANNYVIGCTERLGSERAYQGKAAEEMQMYCNSLAEYLARMILLYQAASTYIWTAYETQYYNEQQVIDWIVSQMGEG